MTRDVGPLAVSVAQLTEQIAWLKAEKLHFTTLSAVEKAVRDGAALPGNSVLVTFDDAYRDTFELAWPVLRDAGVPAAIFVPTAYVGGESGWDRPAYPLMTVPQLREIAVGGIELGLHSHQHRNFQTLSEEAIASDVRECRDVLERAGVPYVRALAYPFGARPREAEAKRGLQTRLRELGVSLAFRIGNRINRLPLRDPYEINRIDIRGDRDFAAFRRKVRWGRFW